MSINLYKKIFFLILISFSLITKSVFALTITSTESISISAMVNSSAIVSPGGGSNGSMGIPKTATRFSGYAYPNALVTILENGINRIIIQADATGYFETTLEEKYNNNSLYTLFVNDTKGQRSLLLNYPIVIYDGYVTYISGIRFTPTISTDKTEAKIGDYLTVYGSSLSSQNMQVVIDGENSQTFTLTSDADGLYKIIIPLGSLSKGDYSIHVNYTDDTRISKLIKFIIGDANILSSDSVTNIPGDCNADNVINLVDFSVLAFWYGKDNPPVCVDTNHDGIINLVDFSILAFYWTG
jgi:hypothetical protein